MNPDDHPAPPPPTPSGPSRRVTAFAVVTVALMLVVAVAVVLTIRGDGDAAGSSPSQPPPPQPTAAATTTTLDPKTEVVARLREILRVRDRALVSRNASLLDDIYTVDCNCLKDGRAAIQQLREEKVVWKGLSTSLTVQKTQRVNDRLWEVIGVLSTPPVQVENETGGLLRTVPPERNQLRFALAKPIDADEWLLGHVSLLNEGG
jgi:hypothetical protein